MLTHQESEEINTYACLDGTEIGEYLCALLGVRDYSEAHGMSSDFSNSIDQELRHWLKRFKSETVILEKVEPQPDMIYKTIKWLNE